MHTQRPTRLVSHSTPDCVEWVSGSREARGGTPSSVPRAGATPPASACLRPTGCAGAPASGGGRSLALLLLSPLLLSLYYSLYYYSLSTTTLSTTTLSTTTLSTATQAAPLRPRAEAVAASLREIEQVRSRG